MNLDNLIQSTGEWLRGTGPESDVVVSTRIRLREITRHFPLRTGPARIRKPRSSNWFGRSWQASTFIHRSRSLTWRR